jgi:hypothetical protein
MCEHVPPKLLEIKRWVDNWDDPLQRSKDMVVEKDLISMLVDIEKGLQQAKKDLIDGACWRGRDQDQDGARAA